MDTMKPASVYVKASADGSGTVDYSNFVNYSGIATAYHIHTYNNAKINSITLSVTSGLSVSFANADQAFTAYSTDVFF